MDAADAIPETAGERAYRHIREQIISGRLAGGEMLSEVTLARELGMSRSPIRPALVRLQEEGWVRIYPKRGALVQDLSDRTIRELAQTKTMIESFSVRTAPEHALAPAVEELRPLLPLQREALEAGDVAEFVELSIAFHRALAAIAGNLVLLELYDRLADRQRHLLFRYGQQLIGRADEIVAEHAEMLDAATDQEPGRFEAVLRHHLAQTYGGPAGDDPLRDDR